MYKLKFETEELMLRAFLGCKFAMIECNTEYVDEENAELDTLSFEMKGEI
jgi:hypothetical protein